MENLTPVEIVRRFERIKSDRVTWENRWQKVATYCLPQKANVTVKRTEGSQLPSYIYDTTAITSAKLLAAGLHGYLTSPSSKWFAIRVDDSLMGITQVRLWLESAETAIYKALNNSNFYQQNHEGYRDLAVFGTECLYEEEDERDYIRFDARPIQEIFIVEDSRGKVDTVIRFYELTAEQAVKEYGQQAGKEALKAYEDKDYDKKVEYLQCVGERYRREAGKKDYSNKPYYSKIITYKGRELVGESGYDEMPFFVVRYDKVSGERYGYSPAMEVEGTIYTANSIKEDILKAGNKVVNPPVQVPNKSYLLPIDLRPGAINYRMSASDNDKIEQLNIHGDLPAGEELLAREQEDIKRAFHVDLFLMLEQKVNMTATEVIQRVEEKMLILGPTLGRLQTELLDPIIKRTFNILLRRGAITPPPLELQGQHYNVEYVSRLAKAQKLSENQSIQQFLMAVGQLSPLSPPLLDKVEFDEVVDVLADVLGVTPKIIRDDKQVQAIREQRAQQQQATMALQAADSLTKSGKQMAEADRATRV